MAYNFSNESGKTVNNPMMPTNGIDYGPEFGGNGLTAQGGMNYANSPTETNPMMPTNGFPMSGTRGLTGVNQGGQWGSVQPKTSVNPLMPTNGIGPKTAVNPVIQSGNWNAAAESNQQWNAPQNEWGTSPGGLMGTTKMANKPSSYTPGYATGSVDGETAQKTGLGTASNILSDTLGKTYEYPSNINDQMQGPASMGISDNVGYNAMQTVDGIGANGYQDLQNALMDPILRQGQQAQQRVADQYSGQGLYGSVGGGLMSGAQADSQLATQDALSGAVADRYQLQLDDQQQQINQNMNLFNSQAQTADQQNLYNTSRNQTNYGNQQALNDFYNSQLAGNQQYALDRQNFNTGIDEMNYQRALQLAGQGNSGAMVQANQQAASDAAKAQQNAALYGGIGSIAGGLMGNYDGSGNSGWNFGGVGDALSGAYDWLTG